jgi:hypothetical protein
MLGRISTPVAEYDLERPLLTADEAARFDDEAATAAFVAVFDRIIRQIPGEPWASTPSKIEELGPAELAG